MHKISQKISIRPAPLLLKILILTAVYFATGKAGLSLDAVSSFATLVWPPTGIAFVSLLLFGYRLWPGIAIGAFLVNYSTGASVPVALGIAAGNTLEALVGVYLIQRFFPTFSPRLERLRDVLGLIIFVALGSTLISATIGTTSLLWGDVITSSEYFLTWLAWWVGDMLGDLIVAPLLLVWFSRYRIEFTLRKAITLLMLFVLISSIALFLFTGFFGVNTRMLPIEYLLIPPLIWIALQFGQRSSVTALFLISIIAIWGTVDGYGVFVGQRISESLLLLQGFIGINACVFLILSAIVSEFKELELRKNDFVALASHELKTPVTSLKLFIQLLLMRYHKKGSSHTTYILKKMSKQIDRQTELVNELLDISRMQAGKLEYRMEEFLLDELILDTVENMQALTKTHSLIFKGSSTKTVYADRERIGQVLINLITNSIKHSPKAKKILIRIRDNKNKVQVSIKDFGEGIALRDQEKIFQRFFRISSKSQSTYPGLGLGLFIASEIIKRHNGKIWVESAEKKGATFSFTLPGIRSAHSFKRNSNKAA